MRLAALTLVLALVLPVPASAVEVRVKSKHDKAKLEGVAGPECHKVGAEETLRAGVIGPAAVRVSLRRAGDAKAAPIAVRLMRDGREIAKVQVGGKPKDAIVGDSDLAGPVVEKTVDIPAGPHTLFVEVGAGKAAVLIAFEDAKAPSAAIAKAPAKAEPLVALVEPAKAPAKAEPALAKPELKKAAAKADKAAASTKTEPAKVEPTKAEPVVAKAEPEPAKATKLEDTDSTPPQKPVVSIEPERAAERRSGTRLEDSDEPAQHIAYVRDNRVRFLLGPRVGIADQTQVAAAGPVVGLSFRWAALGTSTPAGTSGLLVGLSADFLRYSIGFKVPQSVSLPAFTDTATVFSVPIVAEGTWCFGNAEKARLSPYLGVDIGVAAGSVTSDGLNGSESHGFARLAVGAHAGLEYPIGHDRLGVEARWLWAKVSSSGPVRDLEVGGLLVQASWRFGL
jgi:hypothetical protein